MTFLSRPVAPFKVDALRATYSGAMVTNPVIQLSGTLTNTRATVSGNEVTLYSGSHWRIEVSNSVIGAAVRDFGTNSEIYSITDGGTIGTPGNCGAFKNNTPTNNDYLTKGRSTACALVLNSDISTSKTLNFRILGPAAKLLAFVPNYDPSDTGYRYNYGIIKIMELPA